MDFLVTFAPADGRESYIVSRFPVLDLAVEYALALHRSSNVKHVVTILGPERVSDTDDLPTPRLTLYGDNNFKQHEPIC